MTVRVSVIIPVYRDWERLDRCLAALEQQTLPADQFEIIVADNEPGGHRAPVRLPPNGRLIHVQKPGSYTARNAAVKVARARFLAFTDSDCKPAPEWLQAGLEALEENPDRRVTGPISLFREPGASYFAFIYEDSGGFGQQRLVERGYCLTANLIVARDVLERVGPFNEGLFSGGDREWGQRAFAAGIPIIYLEQVEVGHPARPTVGDLLKRRRRFAGAAAERGEAEPLRYIGTRLRPPRLMKFLRGEFPRNRSSNSRSEGLIFFLLHWLVRLSEAWEFALVRIGIKRPNRA